MLGVAAMPLLGQSPGARDSAALAAAERRWADANVACDTSAMAGVLGDVAVVDGTLRVIFKGREPDPAIPPATYSRVYIRSGSRWLLLAHHGTRITPNPNSR